MISHSNVEYLHNPMWYSLYDFPPSIEFLCMLNHTFFFILIPFLFIADVFCSADVLCFELRSYVCKILGLYHVLMYVCRVHQFVVPRFFACTDFLGM
jgi:hypothetical protein